MTKKDIVQQEVTDILSKQWASKAVSEGYVLSYFTQMFHYDDGFDESWITGSEGFTSRFPKATPAKVA